MEYDKAMKRLRLYDSTNIKVHLLTKSYIQKSPRTVLKYKYRHSKKNSEYYFLSKKDSHIFNQIFFAQSPLFHSLQNYQFPNKLKILSSQHPKRKQSYLKTKNIFKEIKFNQEQLWICQLNNEVYIYFSHQECKEVPKSKCCESNIEIILSLIITISCLKCKSVLYNLIFKQGQRCKQATIKEVHQNYEQFLRKISQSINSGKYKSQSLIHYKLKPTNQQSSQILVRSICYKKNLNQRKNRTVQSLKTYQSSINDFLKEI